jgi:hypothetical protein
LTADKDGSANPVHLLEKGGAQKFHLLGKGGAQKPLLKKRRQNPVLQNLGYYMV